MMRQADLFGAGRGPAAPVPETPDADAIRARLHAVLDTLRAARAMPWEPARVRTQEHLFQNMTNWLPEVERDALRLAFAAEMARLRQA